MMKARLTFRFETTCAQIDSQIRTHSSTYHVLKNYYTYKESERRENTVRPTDFNTVEKIRWSL